MDYKKILEGVVDIINTTEKSDIGFANICTYIGEKCPELQDQESEDEKIRKWLIDWAKAVNWSEQFTITKKQVLTWLEKQRDYNRLIEEMRERKELLFKEKEKATSANDKLLLGGRIAMLQELLAFNICNTTDKVEPKFKVVGDWIVQEKIGVYKVIEICESWYEVVDNKDKHYSIGFDKEYMCHLWTIKDAKDGDILVVAKDCSPFIFKGFTDSLHQGHPVAYGGIDKQANMFIPSSGNRWWDDGEIYYPATKEQRDFLFQKMKEAGYTWDAKKKELKKIEPNALDTDKVIEWLDEHVPTKFEDMQNYVNQFKDFGL